MAQNDNDIFLQWTMTMSLQKFPSTPIYGCTKFTHLLHDRMRESAPSRIIQVNSEGHRFSSFDPDDLGWERRHYTGRKGYGASKTAQLLSVWEFSDLLPGTNVTINAMHPGDVRTNTGNNNGFLCRLFKRTVIWLMLKDPAISGEALYYLAAAPELAGNSMGKSSTKEFEGPGKGWLQLGRLVRRRSSTLDRNQISTWRKLIVPETLVFFATRDGHSRELASRIGERLRAPVHEIEDLVRRKGLIGYLRTGAQPSMKTATPIRYPGVELEGVKLVVLVQPVWAASFCPPIRSWLLAHRDQLQGTRLALLASCQIPPPRTDQGQVRFRVRQRFRIPRGFCCCAPEALGAGALQGPRRFRKRSGKGVRLLTTMKASQAPP